MARLTKEQEYAVKILAQIQEMFDNEDCENHISKNELLDGDNLTHFMHAVSNIAPARIGNALTGKNNDLIESNHIANRLLFNYIKTQD